MPYKTGNEIKGGNLSTATPAKLRPVTLLSKKTAVKAEPKGLFDRFLGWLKSLGEKK